MQTGLEEGAPQTRSAADLLHRVFPPAAWLGDYRAAWLAKDVLAGVTLAAYAVPVSLAYASLAGLPPHYGIYCYLLGGLGYALFGSSRQLAVGPTSAISMLVGVSVASMAGGDPVRWLAIASLSALVVAAICVIAWALRLSTLVSFISDTILLGFKAGAALTIAMTQLPKLFGVKGGGESFFARVWTLVGQLGGTNLAVLAFGLAALALLLLGGKYLPGRPVALFVVVLAIVAMSTTSLANYGLTIVGELPPGLPAFRMPSLRVSDVDGVIPLGFACFLLAYIEGVSAARTLAKSHGYSIDPRQELLGLGVANLFVAFFQGYPVAGGLSQSAVNDKAGARTPLALVFASGSLALCLLFLTGLLRNLPNVVLASIVLVAVKDMIQLREIRRLRDVSVLEFRVAMAALVGVLLLGILKGVMLAAIASLLLLLARVARPHVAFLGRIPGTKRYTDLERNPDNELVPGAILVRPESALLYFNVDSVQATIWRAAMAAGTTLRLLVIDLSSTTYVDLAGARMLETLRKDLADRGVRLRLVEARAEVRDILRAKGFEEQLGKISRRDTLADAVEQLQSAPAWGAAPLDLGPIETP
jgi:high affinity sulfate transporter 1